MNTAIQETGIRELSEQEMASVTGGFNSWQTGGLAVFSLAIASTAAVAGFGIPIGIAMFGLGSYKTWRNIVSH